MQMTTHPRLASEDPMNKPVWRLLSRRVHDQLFRPGSDQTHLYATQTIDRPLHHIATFHRADTGWGSRENDVTWEQLEQARQVSDGFSHIPDQLIQIASLATLAVDVQGNSTLGQLANTAAWDQRAGRRGVVKGFAHFPGTTSFFSLRLQIPAGHVQTHRVSPHTFSSLLHSQITPALGQSHDEF